MNVIKPRRTLLTGGTPMHEALTPAQCAEMRTFLRTLMHYGTGKRIGQRAMTRFLAEYVRVTVRDKRRRAVK